MGLLFPLLEQVVTPVMERHGQAAREHSPPISTAPNIHSPIVWFEGKLIVMVTTSIEANVDHTLSPTAQEGVASFFRLLISMLRGSSTNQRVFLLTEGPATIGALLQKVSSVLSSL